MRGVAPERLTFAQVLKVLECGINIVESSGGSRVLNRERKLVIPIHLGKVQVLIMS